MKLVYLHENIFVENLPMYGSASIKTPSNTANTTTTIIPIFNGLRIF